ncbi:LSU ribosomal protein L20p [Candidatus Vidania fulgoroideae]|uniref:Large ribosomal subunit protein bL20 n=1 Tax=Candidatus Vidania fulgoroideorum TaxID=881286 RepID=A0A346E0I8_9PROT|nr:LSU ribosomal protein L20p [Candidatus Vidania fulgoroideae]WDI79443.1 50S ribosomal protein L20 [Candidatus Vidania fulgoroideae]WDR79190.1 50S ribosomal protein L20 [Candidatus Vidania fulgoroideae]
MSRVKRGVFSKKKHKKIIKRCKGFTGRRKNVFRISKQAYIKSLQYFYRDTRNKKRDFRKLWIININFYLRKYNIKYSRFIKYIKELNININRKSLYYLCKEYNMKKLIIYINEKKYLQN